MKNIYEILTALGIEVPEEKKADFEKDLVANYKTVAEVEKKDAKITALQEQLTTATDGLKKFDGVDADGMRAQITKLQGDLTAKDAEYQAKIADMEFDNAVAAAIGEIGRAHD